MKTTRKILALVLAMAMIMAMATTVFAAGSIKVEGTSENEYTIYKFLDAETIDGKTVYKLAAGWTDFPGVDNVDKYLTFNNGYVSWINSETDSPTVAALAELAKAYIANKGITSSVKIYAAADDTAGKPNIATGLDDGYYVLVSNAGHSGIVLVNGNSRTVKDKNPDGGDVGGGDEEGLPNVKKSVEEDSNAGAWTDSNTADIGQAINFQTVITCGKGGTNYVLHDKMASQLTLNTVTGITLNGSNVDASYYSIKTGTDCIHKEDCAFEVAFVPEFLATLKDNDQIVVSYTAYLNSNAAAGTGYENETWLTHGEGLETTHDITTSKTFSLTVVKEGHNSVALENAEFALKNAAGKYYNMKDGVVSWVEKLEDATKYLSTKNGEGQAVLTFTGLDAAENYQLVETNAPSGYVLATDIESITITNGNKSATVTNSLGTALPETGGIGTTIFYTIGGIMVLAAVVLLVTKKRMAVK